MSCCEVCGERFSFPLIRTRWENLDGENGWQERRDAFCPECGSQEFYEEERDMGWKKNLSYR